MLTSQGNIKSQMSLHGCLWFWNSNIRIPTTLVSGQGLWWVEQFGIPSGFFFPCNLVWHWASHLLFINLVAHDLGLSCKEHGTNCCHSSTTVIYLRLSMLVGQFIRKQSYLFTSTPAQRSMLCSCLATHIHPRHFHLEHLALCTTGDTYECSDCLFNSVILTQG